MAQSNNPKFLHAYSPASMPTVGPALQGESPLALLDRPTLWVMLRMLSTEELLRVRLVSKALCQDATEILLARRSLDPLAIRWGLKLLRHWSSCVFLQSGFMPTDYAILNLARSVPEQDSVGAVLTALWFIKRRAGLAESASRILVSLYLKVFQHHFQADGVMANDGFSRVLLSSLAPLLPALSLDNLEKAAIIALGHSISNAVDAAGSDKSLRDSLRRAISLVALKTSNLAVVSADELLSKSLALRLQDIAQLKQLLPSWPDGADETMLLSGLRASVSLLALNHCERLVGIDPSPLGRALFSRSGLRSGSRLETERLLRSRVSRQAGLSATLSRFFAGVFGRRRAHEPMTPSAYVKSVLWPDHQRAARRALQAPSALAEEVATLLRTLKDLKASASDSPAVDRVVDQGLPHGPGAAS